MRKLPLVIGLASSLGLSACGGGASATQPSSPTTNATTTAPQVSVKAAGAEYLKLVAPTNEAIQAFSTTTATWSDTTSASAAQAAAAPLISSFQSLQNGLVTSSWPSSAQPDVKSLDSSIGPVVGDLQSIGSTNIFNESSWLATLSRDLGVLATNVGIVRHDLGLPAA